MKTLIKYFNWDIILTIDFWLDFHFFLERQVWIFLGSSQSFKLVLTLAGTAKPISNHWKTLETGVWINKKEAPQCGLACGHTYSSPSWPSRWQPPWSCPPGAPPLPQTLRSSPASLGQVEPPVAQSSASKVQEKCAEGHGIGRQFLSLSPTFFVTLHFSFYCTAICSSKCLIGQTEKVESISRYGKCAEGLICSGCHRCQV